MGEMFRRLPPIPPPPPDASLLAAPQPSGVPAAVGSVRSPPPSVRLPEVYLGGARECAGFLLQVGLYFVHHPSLSDDQKVATVISHLGGRALEWATAVWRGRGEELSSYADFVRRFREVFDHPPEG